MLCTRIVLVIVSSYMETALPSGAQAQKRTLSCLLFACVNLPTAKAELACFNLITIYGCAKSTGSRMSRFRLLTDPCHVPYLEAEVVEEVMGWLGLVGTAK